MPACVISFLIISCVAATGLAAGCATVSPWEREAHARPDMSFDGNRSIESADSHSADTREGSAGGFGAGGGGCGCN